MSQKISALLILGIAMAIALLISISLAGKLAFEDKSYGAFVFLSVAGGFALTLACMAAAEKG